MDALLVVDMDNGNFWPDTLDELHLVRDRCVAENILETLRQWREHGKLVTFVTYLTTGDPQAQLKQEHSGQKCLVCNRKGNGRLAKFIQHRHGADYEPAFTKITMGAFFNPELSRFLLSKGVTTLVLAGCSTWCCLLETAYGAVESGLNVVLLSSCIDSALPTDKLRKEWIDYVQKGSKNPAQKPSVTIL